MDEKCFFYRLEPVQLLSALIQINEADRGAWITRIALELASCQPVDPFSISLLTEAQAYKKAATERARIAGLASAEKRKQRTFNRR